jgi:hypothetical protein
VVTVRPTNVSGVFGEGEAGADDGGGSDGPSDELGEPTGDAVDDGLASGTTEAGACEDPHAPTRTDAMITPKRANDERMVRTLFEDV